MRLHCHRRSRQEKALLVIFLTLYNFGRGHRQRSLYNARTFVEVASHDYGRCDEREQDGSRHAA